MTYVRSLVTFVDVLGFRDLVTSDPSGENVLDVVSRFRAFGTEDLYDERAARQGTALHFSDSIVRSVPLVAGRGWQSDRTAVIQELEDLTYLQGELAARGILIRGAIAIGQAHADSAGVFGPAVVDAYRLESTHAVFPRIVLHPDLATTYSTPGARGSGVYADDDVLLTRTSDDGLQFVDYLRNFPREVHEQTSEQEETVRSYAVPRKALIESNLAKQFALSTVRTKYAWLARYHDDVAREFLGDRATDLLVGLRTPETSP